jgi:hypothetical protein
VTQRTSIGTMLQQSREVLTRPSVATFERYEKQGGLPDALVYVALAAAISGVFALAGGLSGFLAQIASTLLGFFVFTYLVYYIGQSRGGTGTLDEVAYSFALFWAPLSVLAGVITLLLVITLIGVLLLPLLGAALIAANIYFAYLAVQASMNLEGSGKVWTTLLLAGLGALVFNLVVGAILR